MDLRITPGLATGAGSAAATAAQKLRPAAGAAGVGGVSGGPNFASALDSALKGVSQAQKEATALQRDFQMGVKDVSLEETMVSMQKAQVGFQAALTVRNRLVSAYSDIMNMQV